MALHRRNAKRDANEREIIDALVSYGFSVEQISKRGCGDLLLGRGGRTRVVEVKGKRGALTADQERWWEEWRGNRRIVIRNIAECSVLAKTWPYMDDYVIAALEEI
jgi:hypothetical protein